MLKIPNHKFGFSRYMLSTTFSICLSSLLFLTMIRRSNFQVQIVSLDEETSEFAARSTFDHPYPTTKIMWIPDSKASRQL